MDSVLHIFNGDCAYDAWRGAGGKGEALVWRENYLEGDYSGGVSLDAGAFLRRRAAFLARMSGVPPEPVILRALFRQEEELIRAADRGRRLLLFFDCCMFDFAILGRIFFLLADRPVLPPIDWAVLAATGPTVEFFQSGKMPFRSLGREAIDLGAAAWRAAVAGREALERLAATADFSPLPELRDAVERRCAEFPGADGLGRTERQILEIIRSGEQSPVGIFRALGRYEKLPFLGDTSCWRLIDDLAARGLLRLSGLPEGRTVLDGLSGGELSAVRILID